MHQSFLPYSVSSLKQLPAFREPSIVALGNFDGVHIGHQKLLLEAQELAKRSAIGSVVALTFEPHPSRFFNVGSFRGELQRVGEKVNKIQRCIGQSATVKVIEFNRELADLSPEEFCSTVLSGWLNAKFVVVGSNFQFGKGRAGTVEKMSQIGSTQGFKVVALEPVTFDGEIVSSSRVRKLISQDGGVRVASLLLGSPYEFSSIVVSGQRLGRKLGFPTLNISPLDFLLPRCGVYVVGTSFKEDNYASKHLSVMNFGNRPTVASGALSTTCEVHVIAKSLPELYGQQVRISMYDRIRDEKKFTTTDELITAIQDDILVAKSLGI